jgi:hypothetical protein
MNKYIIAKTNNFSYFKVTFKELEKNYNVECLVISFFPLQEAENLKPKT